MSRRRKPGLTYRLLILSAQQNRCYYCGVEFLIEQPHFDHFNPYSYSFDSSPENFVAACRDCNAIKADKVFDTREQAVAFIQQQRMSKGKPVFRKHAGRVTELKRKCEYCGELFRPLSDHHKHCQPRCYASSKRVKRRWVSKCHQPQTNAPTGNP